MFQHLDDPAPFWPDDRFRAAVLARGRRLRLRRRLTASLGAAALTVALLGGAAAAYVERRDAAIDRVDVRTSPSIDGAVNILLVGSDERIAGFPDSQAVAGARADAIMVVRLQTDGSVGLLGIPRDLVNLDTGQKVNGYDGDPQALLDTVGQFLGLPVDHYVEIDMAGFVELVDEVGGLDVAVAAPLYDDQSGLALEPTPCTTLDGATTLALVRARHLQGDDSGDFGRMARGQALLAAAVGQLADAADDPLAIDAFSQILADYAVVDDGLSLGRMVELGQALAAAGPDGIHATPLPLVGEADSASIYLAPEAAAVLQQFGAPAGVSVPPAPSASVAVPGPEPATQIHPC